jgi:hypothetical protein
MSSSMNTSRSPRACLTAALRAALAPAGFGKVINRAPWRPATAAEAASRPSLTTITSAPTRSACGAIDVRVTSRYSGRP